MFTPSPDVSTPHPALGVVHSLRQLRLSQPNFPFRQGQRAERPQGLKGSTDRRTPRRGQCVVLLFVPAFVCLYALLYLTADLAVAQDNVQLYSVEPGDTLGLIAERFNVTVDQLIEFNGIADPNLIQVGQELRIPAAGDTPGLNALPLATVQARPGESLATLAERLSLEPDLLATLNSISNTARLYPSQPIFVPQDQAPAEPLRWGAVTDVVLPAQLVQGQTGRLYVSSKHPISLTAAWNGLPLAVSTVPLPASQPPTEQISETLSTTLSITETVATKPEPLSLGSAAKQFALLPVPALLAPQQYAVAITQTTSSGIEISRDWLVEVQAGDYASAQINLPPETAQLLAPETVQDEIAKLWTVWSQFDTPLLWDSTLKRPLAPEFATTSPYGTRRSYNGGPYSSYHSGQDFGAPIGTIIQAPAAGIVALAEPLNVRGNAVLLDHGQGIYTGYWHLNELKVVVGQAVNAGDVIGLVGTTGLSTGAHLHWELRIYGIGVDPMQFLDEPLLPR